MVKILPVWSYGRAIGISVLAMVISLINLPSAEAFTLNGSVRFSDGDVVQRGQVTIFNKSDSSYRLVPIREDSAYSVDALEDGEYIIQAFGVKLLMNKAGRYENSNLILNSNGSAEIVMDIILETRN